MSPMVPSASWSFAQVRDSIELLVTTSKWIDGDTVRMMHWLFSL